MEYRDFILIAIQNLLVSERETFTSALNLQMSGEFKDVDEIFENGEVLRFDLAMLQASGDPNVLKLVSAIEVLRNTILDLMVENNISEEDMDM
jgi:hypothetical protein